MNNKVSDSENHRPLILVTNDDGIHARGLDALAEVAGEFGDVVVISSPESMSGMSHAITIKVPLRVRLMEETDRIRKYVMNGTPVDGVKLAFNSLLPRHPDLVLSGINHGSNSSSSSLYSGTLAAAMEGAVNYIPSIAFSLLDYDPGAEFGPSRAIAREIVDMVLKQGLPGGICLNVNIPAVPSQQIRGIRICRQTKGYWKEEFDFRKDPHGMDYYWLTGYFNNREPDAEDTDEWALSNNYVSMVPINTDFTSYSFIQQMKEWQPNPVQNEGKQAI